LFFKEYEIIAIACQSKLVVIFGRPWPSGHENIPGPLGDQTLRKDKINSLLAGPDRRGSPDLIKDKK
jgi:hypothetical protein